MRIGYVRVSTVEQHEERQIIELQEKANVERTFLDKLSGKNTERPELQKMIDFAREGDTIYVSEFSRLARSTKDLLDIVQKLQSMGLPMDDDWLYETFGVEKPKDYDQQKAEAQANKEAVRKALHDSGDEDEKQPLNGNKKAFKNSLNRFFGIAPNTGADTDF